MKATAVSELALRETGADTEPREGTPDRPADHPPIDRLVAASIAAALLAVAVLDRSGIAAFALGQPRTIPSMLGAGLLALAAVLAWLLGSERTGAERDDRWRIAAVLLGLLAVEQATSLHHWAADWLDVPRSLLLVPVVAAGTAAIAIGLPRLLDEPKALPLWAVGAGAWLGGQAAEAAIGGRWQHQAAAGLELVGCLLLALALLAALPARLRPWRGLPPEGAIWLLAQRAVAAAQTRRAVTGLAAAIGGFALLGGLLIVLDREFLGPVQNAPNPLQWFDLNQELTFPAYFSGLLLAAMAALAVIVSRLPSVRAGSAWPWLGMAAIVALLAFDEVIDLHGRAQRVTDIEAQILLAPLILAAAVVGLILLRRVWTRRQVRNLFIGGALAWGLAMAIDPATHPGSPLAFPEEVLEMIGSAMFLLALLLLARGGLESERELPEASVVAPAGEVAP